MDELASTDVRIVLNIKEGKGFEQILLPTLVVATLNGHSLETEVIEPSSNPQYDHDLVWEVDKNRLRKMRSGQVPLKLECFAIKGKDSREKLGYLMLSLRCAQMFHRNRDLNLKINWHKLLGLRNDLKIHKPELLLGLSIHDRDSVTFSPQLELKIPENCEQTDLQSNKFAPILLRDERLIQLGPLDTCHELFLLNITAVSATNVDLLLSSEYYADMRNNLNFWCKILENELYFNKSKKEYGEHWILNEKIVIRIRSSLRVLKEYLQFKPHLTVYLKYKNDTIGTSQVNLQPLVPTDNVEEFLKSVENSSSSLTERCYLNKSNLTENDETECTRSYIDLKLKLKYIGDKTDVAIETSNTVIGEPKDNFRQMKSCW